MLIIFKQTFRRPAITQPTVPFSTQHPAHPQSTIMLKSALLFLSVLSTIVSASISSCGDCSPQCLDCRVRGYTRLSPDKSLAECFLEFSVAEPPYPCPTLGGPGTDVYPGVPVCRQQRCILERGERCKLVRLNEDTCNFFVSSANFALDSDLAGCRSYLNVPDPTPNGSCPPGYSLACYYPNLPDTLPVGGGQKSGSQIAAPPSNNFVLDTTSIYTTIPDTLALTEYDAALQATFPAGAEACPNTIGDGKHFPKLQLVFEGCVVVTGTVVETPFAGILANGESAFPYETLIVFGMAGSYFVTPSNATCLSQDTTLYVPRCYYLLKNQDNDPAGCQHFA